MSARPAARRLVIAERFCGPPTSANGGYACGRLAEAIDGPAEVTLRTPPPLERPLAVGRDDEGASLWDGDVLVAQAKPLNPDFEVPPPVGLDEAEEAAGRYEWAQEHPYPTCFVCGPLRAEGDGLRIFPGPVAGRDLYAAPWTPAADLAEEDGLVRPEFAWSALDCPSGLATNSFDGVGRVLLGRLTADLRHPARAGADHVVTAWPIGREGRKLRTGSALFSAAGELLGAAEAVWIEVESARP